MLQNTNNGMFKASREWATRPDDQRFTSLPDMHAFLTAERNRSRATVVSSRKLECRPMGEPGSDEFMTGLEVYGPNGHGYQPTHWSFGQIAQLAGAPAGYLRTLPPPIACDAINYGMRFNRDIEDVGVLLRRNTDDTDNARIAAATGPRYGRVWNADISQALMRKFGDGVTGDWRVPGEFGKDVAVTKANTTLYASDRDMFVFLCDEHNRITVPNRRNGKSGSMARGFFVWNSEVGSQSIGAAFFMFDYVCCNRIVWGMEGYKEIRLRHTVSAPDRWLAEITPVLIEYAEASAKPVEETIRAAQAKKLDDAKAWLANRYTTRMATAYNAAHEREEGRPVETLWDVVTGMTAYAKTLPHQDARVAVERDAGKVLELVAV